MGNFSLNLVCFFCTACIASDVFVGGKLCCSSALPTLCHYLLPSSLFITKLKFTPVTVKYCYYVQLTARSFP